MLTVRGHTVPDAELTWRFSRSSGPGGQGVNTADSRVQLTFDLGASEAFPDRLKRRMLARLGRAVVTATASEQRSQLLNRHAALERLAAILEDAMRPPPAPRVPTKPSRGSQRRRLDAKRRRGDVKRLRGRPND